MPIILSEQFLLTTINAILVIVKIITKRNIYLVASVNVLYQLLNFSICYFPYIFADHENLFILTQFPEHAYDKMPLIVLELMHFPLHPLVPLLRFVEFFLFLLHNK